VEIILIFKTFIQREVFYQDPLFFYGEENVSALSFQMTSTPLLAHRRLQLSIALHKVDAINLMQEAPTVIFPILWIDEVCTFPTLHATLSVLLAS
jgi:hypothetical protein